MNPETIMILFLSFLFFDVASRNMVIARIVAALWSLAWLLIFWKRVTRFEMDIPSEWFWKVTSGHVAVNFGLSSISILVAYLVIQPTWTWFALPISGIAGFSLYVYKTAREMRWRELTKFYKIKLCFEKLYDK